MKIVGFCNFIRYTGLSILIVITHLSCLNTSLKGFISDSIKSKKGLRYFLPKSLIEVKVSVTKQITVEVTDDLKLRKKKNLKREISVSTMTIADKSDQYFLDMSPPYFSFYEDNLNVSVTEQGFLKSINFTADGKAPEVIKNIFQTVANASGFFQPKIGILEEKEEPCKTDVKELNLKLELLPRTMQLLVRRNADACSKLIEIRATEKNLGKLQNAIRSLQYSISKSENTDVISKKLDLLYQEREKVIKDLQAKQVTLFDVLDSFLKENGHQTSPTVDVFSEQFDLYELPKTQNSAVLKDAITVKNIIDTLESFLKAKMFFKRSGVAIYIDARATENKNSPKDDCNKNDESLMYYRQDTPVNFSIFRLEDLKETDITEETDSDSRTVINEASRVVPIFDPGFPSSCLAFQSNALSRRSLTLSFDNLGRPITMNRTSTSSVEALTSVIASSSKNLREEYKNAIKDQAEVKKMKQQMHIDGMQYQVELLQKEKLKIDESVNLAGEVSSIENQIKKKQLDSELLLLQKQLELEKSQKTKESEIELEKLKSELLLLEQEVKNLKARKDLEEAKK